MSVPPKSVDAGAVTELDLSGIGNPEELDGAAIRVESTGPVGSVIASFANHDQGHIVRAAPFRDIGDPAVSTGAYAWRLDGQVQSRVYITNVGKVKAAFGGSILPSSGPTYFINAHYLDPGETYVFDLGQIRDREIPDPHGVRLPKNAAAGHFEWSTISGDGTQQLMGRAEILDGASSVINSSNAYVCRCAGPNTSAYLSPDIVNIGLGLDFPNLFLTEVSTNLCTGVQSRYNVNPGPWTVTVPSILSVTGGQSGASTVAGLAVGTSPFSTTTYLYQWDFINCILHATKVPVGGTGNVIQVTQSPTAVGMSSGDTNDTITVAVSPSSAASSGEAIAPGLLSNPNSSTAANLTFTPPASFTSSDSWKIGVTAAANSPSGIFSATACDYACSKQATTITVPPQVILQMMYAEANGTGNQIAMQSLGETIENRFSSPYFTGAYNTWQNSVVVSQVALNTSITTGVQPELNAAIDVFTDANGGWCSALSWWSPTAPQWTVVQSAISSGSGTFPANTGAPTYSAWPTSAQQILQVSSVGTKAGGIPNFLHLAPRGSTQPAAVSASCN